MVIRIAPDHLAGNIVVTEPISKLTPEEIQAAKSATYFGSKEWGLWKPDGLEL